jgi:acyl carrier protein
MDNFYKTIAELLEVESVQPDQKLESFECWDSLTQLSIIAAADTNFKANITAKEVIEAETVGGLYNLIEKKRKK